MIWGMPGTSTDVPVTVTFARRMLPAVAIIEVRGTKMSAEFLGSVEADRHNKPMIIGQAARRREIHFVPALGSGNGQRGITAGDPFDLSEYAGKGQFICVGDGLLHGLAGTPRGDLSTRTLSGVCHEIAPEHVRGYPGTRSGYRGQVSSEVETTTASIDPNSLFKSTLKARKSGSRNVPAPYPVTGQLMPPAGSAALWHVSGRAWP